MIVCLFPKFLNDIRFRMRDARSCFLFLFPYTVSPYDFLVSLTWVFLFRVGEKSISIPENDFLLSRG